MILLLLSLVAGILTVLAPCTLALLPVIVGGTLAGGTSYKRAITVTAALGVSVILFTLVLKVSTAFINVPQSFWEIFSGVIIIVLGITMIFPVIMDKIPYLNKINRDSNKMLGSGFKKQNLFGDILVGAALGPVFSSCSPTYFLIIATVLPRSIQAGLIYLLVYTFGLCATLLLVAIAGQKLLSRFEAASDPNGWFKRGIGVLFLVVGVVIATGLQAKFELAFANSNFLNVSGIEKALLSKAGPINANGGTGSTASSTAPGTDYATATSTVGSTATSSAARITAESLVYPKAPEITKAAGFLNNNGQPISLASLKGKVVLVDFWDYSCINCQREIPYVEAWYKKYNPEGLVVVGVHTPEFAFEKVSSNVAAAAKSLGITYPIVLDNDYGTWNAFNNEYWPQVYLINSDGFVVYSHSGEGEYAQTEAAIQKALTERVKNEGLSTSISSGTVNPSTTEVGTGLGSPETYFGYNRNQYLANGKPGEADTQTLALPSTTQLNQLNLGGTWTFKAEYAETSDTTNGAIEYQFQAKNVYLVATGNPSAKVKILLDGKPLGANAGADVAADGTMTINADKLYKLVSLPDYGTHTILIQLISGTLDGYTFTFG